MNVMKMLITVGRRATLSGLLALTGLPPLLADTPEATIVVPGGPLTVTTHQPVAFEGRSVDSRQSEAYVVKAIRWRFGDGRSATGARATHVFRKPGAYRVAMIVRYTRRSCVRQNPDGTCSRYRITTGHARATRQVMVVAPPVAGSFLASNLNPLRGGSFTLTPNYAQGIGSLSQGLGCPPSGAPTTPIQADWLGPRTFVLTVTNAAGMTAQASVSVTPQRVVMGTIQPALATRTVATSTSFGVAVTGGQSGAVSWASSSGSWVGNTWVAPASPQLVRITAISVDDPSQQASTTVSVVDLPEGTLRASPPNPLYGATRVTVVPEFQAASVAKVGTTPGASDISANPISGQPLPVQPEGFTRGATYWLRLINAAGDTRDVSVNLAVTRPNLSPIQGPLYVTTGLSASYRATVTGAEDPSILWFVDGLPGGNASVGTIRPDGLYSAPGGAGAHLIEARSKADPTLVQSVSIEVMPMPTASLGSSAQVVTSGSGAMLIPTFGHGSGRIGTSGAGSDDLIPVVTSGVAVPTGPLDASRTYTLTVTSLAGTEAMADQSIRVVAPPVADITAPEMATEGAPGLEAHVVVQAGCSYIWEVTGGTMTSGGDSSRITFTAGPVGVASLQCKVTNEAGTAMIGRRDLGVISAPAISQFTAEADSVRRGATTQLMGGFVGGTGRIDPVVGPVASGVPVAVSPDVTTTYTLTVTNAAGAPVSRSLTLTVAAGPDATVIAPDFVQPGAAGLSAFVPSQAGCTYRWAVEGGFITAGGDSAAVTFTAAGPGVLRLRCLVTDGTGASTEGSREVAVVDPPTIVAFGASRTSAPAGGRVVLMCLFTDGTAVLNQGIGPVTSGQAVVVNPVASTTYTVTAQNGAGVQASETLEVVVQDDDLEAVALETERIFLSPGGTFAFQATLGGQVVEGSNGEGTQIRWRVSEGGGEIDEDGRYTAPLLAGTYLVTATNRYDPSRSASAIVEVREPDPSIFVEISPAEVTMEAGRAQPFEAFVAGTSDQGITWSLDLWTEGELVPQGARVLFTPPVSGLYQVLATSQADPSKHATAQVTVNDPGAPVISSFTVQPAIVKAGEPVILEWTVSDAATVVLDGVNVTGRSSLEVRPTGGSLGRATLIATNADGNSYRTLTYAVMSPTIQAFSADPPKATKGGRVRLVPVFLNGVGVIEPGIGPVRSGDEVWVTPRGNTYYRLTVSNEFGIQDTREIHVPVWVPASLVEVGFTAAPIWTAPASLMGPGETVVTAGFAAPGLALPRIHSFQSTDSRVSSTGTLTLRPEFEGGSGAINHGIGPVTSGTSITVPAGQTMAFTLTVTNEFGFITNQTITISGGAVVQEPVLDPSPYQSQLLMNEFLPGQAGSTALVGASDFPSGPFLAAGLPDGRILIGGGQYRNGFLPTASSNRWYMYDSRSKSLRSLPIDASPSRAFGSMTPLADGRVLLLGGEEVSTFSTGVTKPDAWIFDPAQLRSTQGSTGGTGSTSPWHLSTARMSHAREGHRADLLPDGRVLISGGLCKSIFGYVDGWHYTDPVVTWPTTIEIFEPRTNTFTIIENLNDISSSLDPGWEDMAGITQAIVHQVMLRDGRVIFFGTSAGWTFPVGMFDPRTNQVERLHGPRARVMGNEAHVLPNGLITWASDIAWGYDLGSDYAQFYDPEIHAFYSMDVPTVVREGRFNPTRTGWNPFESILHSDGRVYWPLTHYAGPGPVVALMYPYDITLTPCSARTTVGQSILITGVSMRGETLNWSLDSSNASYDSTSGLFFATQPGTYRLRATDPHGSSAVATIEVLPRPTLTLEPAQGKALPGGRIQFSASLSTTPVQRFQWEVLAGGVGGTVDAEGVYTASSSPGTDRIRVTCPDFPELSGEADITVATLQVALSPTYLELNPGGRFRFSGSATFGEVAWSAPAGGAIQLDGTFTAPMMPGRYSVQARSDLDPSVTSQAEVLVRAPEILLAPSRVILGTSNTYQFQGAVTAGSLAWSVVEPGGGSISSTGLYAAPATQGTFTVRAVSTLDPTQVATATVVVIAGAGGGGAGSGDPETPIMRGVAVAPSLISIKAGTYQPFSATVYGQDDQSVTWQVQSANPPEWAQVDIQQGVFLASHPGTYQVVATSVADGSLLGSAIVVVTSSLDSLADKVPSALSRQGYSVTALQSGKILIAGGWDGSSYRSDCYLYDSETQTFNPTGSMMETKYSVTDTHGNTLSMTVSAGRSGHTATLLKDGRVLIANGIGLWSNDALPPPTTWSRLPFAQVYDPATGTFSLLPPRPEAPTVPGYIGPNDALHVNGTDVLLANGQVLLVGDDFRTGRNTHHLLDPGLDTFSDIRSCGIGIQHPEFGDCGAGIGSWPTATALVDGRALITGGFVARPDPALDAESYDASATVYTPGAGFSPAGTMTSRRTQHTATRLADGRVLIVGGSSASVTRVGGMSYFAPTATAEIFDPATGTFTAVANMKWPRSAHAALLLPTGQVLVVGGYTSQTIQPDGSHTMSYPTETERYDPESNTWSVMDHLDYGLSEPKLALLQDGSVFVAGQIQAPTEPPAQQSQSAGLRMMAAVSVSATSFTVGSSCFGIIPSRWDVLGYPEEAALQSNGNGGLVAATISLAPAGVRYPLSPVRRPSKARISIPLPVGTSPSTNPAAPFNIAVNGTDRFYLFKIRKPNWNFSIIGVKVKVNTGGLDQYVLGGPSNWQGLAQGTFWQVRTQSDIPQLAPGSNNIKDPNVLEDMRKAWARDWLPVTAPPPLTNVIDEYYKVLITFTPETAAAGFPYGVTGNQFISPTSNRLNYSFQIQYTGPNGQTGTFDLSNECVQHSNMSIVAHWDASQLFTNQRYSTWMNSNKWCALPLIQWLGDSTNRQVIGPVNEITLEHGLNRTSTTQGHTVEHLQGDAIDIYHPGCSVDVFHPGSTAKVSLQADGTPIYAGWQFRDQICQLISDADPNNPNDPSRKTLVMWIDQARQDLRAMLERMNDPSHRFVGSGLYLMSVGDGTDAQYVNIRKLLWDGKCTGLNLTQDLIGGEVLGPWIWEGGDLQLAAIKADSGNVHTTHIHIRPQGSLTGHE